MTDTPAPQAGASPAAIDPGLAPRRRIVLASTSRYRRELLGRLLADFDVASPEVDETPLDGERPADAALRLSVAKAQAVARLHPDALVIGSDQTATLDDRTIVGKPGSHARAQQQLRAASGRTLRFHTGVALVCHGLSLERATLVTTVVTFRQLSDRQIEAYLLRERPYDCAGSAKSEGLGIALLESIEGPDPSALVGLPLITVCSMLADADAEVLPA